MTRASLVLAVLALLLPGCGNRGQSVMGAGAASRRSPSMPAVGDLAEYDLALDGGLAGSSGSTGKFTGEGHSVVTVAEATNHGRQIPRYITKTFEVKEEITHRLGPVSSSSTTVSWLGVDTAGNIYLLGEALDGSDWDVVTDADPPISVPSKIMQGSFWSYVAHFASGSTESSSNRCVGVEQLQTPAGDFRAFKISGTVTRTRVGGVGLSISGDEWLSDAIPHVFEVKMDFTMRAETAAAPVDSREVASLQSIRLGR